MMIPVLSDRFVLFDPTFEVAAIPAIAAAETRYKEYTYSLKYGVCGGHHVQPW